MSEFSDLVGKTLSKIENLDSRSIVFHTTDGETYRLYHEEDCCESVSVEDICGNLDDLVGSPLIEADESSSREKLDGTEKQYADSFTWTFYKLATGKGFVTIRWYGESNGCYSESVSFSKDEREESPPTGGVE